MSDSGEFAVYVTYGDRTRKMKTLPDSSLAKLLRECAEKFSVKADDVFLEIKSKGEQTRPCTHMRNAR